MKVTEEELAAYVDGELEGAEAARVALAVAADLELMRRVQHQRQLRQRLGAAFTPIIEQEVPERLSALLRPPLNRPKPRHDPLPPRRTPEPRSQQIAYSPRRDRPLRWAWAAAPLVLAGAMVSAYLALFA